jgi:hypothetical protein
MHQYGEASETRNGRLDHHRRWEPAGLVRLGGVWSGGPGSSAELAVAGRSGARFVEQGEEVGRGADGQAVRQDGEVAVTGHEEGALGDGERHEVFIVGVGRADRGCGPGIRGQDRRASDPGYEGVGVGGGDQAGQLRVGQGTRELGQQRRAALRVCRVDQRFR